MVSLQPTSIDARKTCWRPGLAASLIFAALTWYTGGVRADPLVEPKVFASSGGVLDLLMIAKSKPIPTISFPPPSGGAAINHVGWVYEICPRPSSGFDCPAGPDTVADYGGVRLALQPGDVLKIRLVNRLPKLGPAKVKHLGDPGQEDLTLNPTNLHTHGLIVAPRVATSKDPTFGDYVFVEVYNSANGAPKARASHSHGVQRMDFVDYRINIPRNHPSGAFWFHPHVHGISLNQVSAGLAGIISIGQVRDYLKAAPRVVRHLILKDIQVVAAGRVNAFQGDQSTVAVADGEVLNQEDGDFCEQRNRGGPTFRLGFCGGRQSELNGGNSFVGSRWYFTINGQVFPTIHMTAPEGEIWSLTNASAQFSYQLNLLDDTRQQAMVMQLIAVDGVSISVPAAATPQTLTSVGGNKFKAIPCPAGTKNPLSVCVSQLIMMPSSRAEVWVTYRDAQGRAAVPPAHATATLQQGLIDLGPAAEKWPEVRLAKVEFTQSGASDGSLEVVGAANAALSTKGVFAAESMVSAVAAGPEATDLAAESLGCRPLAKGRHRRIFFGMVTPTDSQSQFGFGYEEAEDTATTSRIGVPGTTVPVHAFDPAQTPICLPLGSGDGPVHETWELINLATETHNFHIHQTKFRVMDASEVEHLLEIRPSATILEDNVPVPFATALISDVASKQNGYCSIDQWRAGQCIVIPVFVDIPFSELGEFVFHCHILAHEDGGMMARIKVVRGPL
jgi:L-ascorbate oxidase